LVKNKFENKIKKLEKKIEELEKIEKTESEEKRQNEAKDKIIEAKIQTKAEQEINETESKNEVKKEFKKIKSKKLEEEYSETNIKLTKTKSQTEENEKYLDEETFEAGGFIAVRIDKNFAKFSFFGVGSVNIPSIKKNENNIENNLGIVKIESRKLFNIIEEKEDDEKILKNQMKKNFFLI
jgi:hypothetical protein